MANTFSFFPFVLLTENQWNGSMELPELKPSTSHVIFHGQPESGFRRRSTIEFMTTVLSYSLSGLSMLINLTEDSFVKDSFNPLCAPLDLTDILNSYPNLPRPDSLVGSGFKNKFNLMTRNNLSLDWLQQFFVSRCKCFSH